MGELHNAELADKVMFIIKKNLNREKCLLEVDSVFSKDYPNYKGVFKEQIGMSLKNYMNRARMSEAEKLLETTTLDLKEVAKAVGINGYFEFTQLFKRLMGVTPSGYRNQMFKVHVSPTDNV